MQAEDPGAGGAAAGVDGQGSPGVPGFSAESG